MANSLRHTAVTCSALFIWLFATGRSVALPPASFMNRVALTAWLDVAGGNAKDVMVYVDVNGDRVHGRTGSGDLRFVRFSSMHRHPSVQGVPIHSTFWCVSPDNPGRLSRRTQIPATLPA